MRRNPRSVCIRGGQCLYSRLFQLQEGSASSTPVRGAPSDSEPDEVTHTASTFARMQVRQCCCTLAPRQTCWELHPVLHN